MHTHAHLSFGLKSLRLCLISTPEVNVLWLCGDLEIHGLTDVVSATIVADVDDSLAHIVCYAVDEFLWKPHKELQLLILAPMNEDARARHRRIARRGPTQLFIVLTAFDGYMRKLCLPCTRGRFSSV